MCLFVRYNCFDLTRSGMCPRCLVSTIALWCAVEKRSVVQPFVQLGIVVRVLGRNLGPYIGQIVVESFMELGSEVRFSRAQVLGFSEVFAEVEEHDRIGIILLA